jgi:hypothetical protein
MFCRLVRVEFEDGAGVVRACPVGWIDNFAMRNFTNDAIFDDTLPIGDGAMEIGNRIPVERLRVSMEDWFRRKGYLKLGDVLVVEEQGVGNRE